MAKSVIYETRGRAREYCELAIIAPPEYLAIIITACYENGKNIRRQLP